MKSKRLVDMLVVMLVVMTFFNSGMVISTGKVEKQVCLSHMTADNEINYLSAQRPYLDKNQIRNEIELVPGSYIIAVNIPLKVVQVFGILEKPDKNGWLKVVVIGHNYVYAKNISLRDFSILSYETGLWNTANYLVNPKSSELIDVLNEAKKYKWNTWNTKRR